MKQVDLAESRRKLDEIDQKIVELFEERMKICEDVAAFKIATGKAVYDPEREKAKLEAVASLAHTEFNQEAVKQLFEEIMSLSKCYQRRLMEEKDAGDTEKGQN